MEITGLELEQKIKMVKNLLLNYGQLGVVRVK